MPPGTANVELDSTNPLQAYESLALLEGTSRMAQQALASGRSARMNSRDAQNLSAYFNKVGIALLNQLQRAEHADSSELQASCSSNFYRMTWWLHALSTTHTTLCNGISHDGSGL